MFSLLWNTCCENSLQKKVSARNLCLLINVENNSTFHMKHFKKKINLCAVICDVEMWICGFASLISPACCSVGLMLVYTGILWSCCVYFNTSFLKIGFHDAFQRDFPKNRWINLEHELSARKSATTNFNMKKNNRHWNVT